MGRLGGKFLVESQLIPVRRLLNSVDSLLIPNSSLLNSVDSLLIFVDRLLKIVSMLETLLGQAIMTNAGRSLSDSWRIKIF